MPFKSTKVIELGSCAFRQPQADSHCRFLHGYRLTAKFWFEANNLDQNNWVVDFGRLKGLKKLMKDQFDHTTCISRTDPKLEQFKRLRDEGVCDLRVMDGVGIEKFAEYCHTVANEYVDELTDGRCKCVKVEVFEHEDNSAIYEVSKSSTELGAEYLDKRMDELTFDDENQMKMSFESDADVKSDATVTRPPFKAKKSAPLYSNKTKGTWVDERGTFGI